MTRTLILLMVLACASAAPPVPVPPTFNIPPVGATVDFVVYPADTNHMGTLFGGKQLAEMDRAAGIAVRRFIATRPDLIAVTSAIERVEFKRPGRVGDLVRVAGRVVRLGERSITVHVRLTPNDSANILDDISWGLLTFVTLDKDTKKSVKHDLDMPRP